MTHKNVVGITMYCIGIKGLSSGRALYGIKRKTLNLCSLWSVHSFACKELYLSLMSAVVYV